MSNAEIEGLARVIFFSGFIIISLLIFSFYRWVYPYYFTKIKTNEIDKFYSFLSMHQDSGLNKNIIIKLGVKNANDFYALVEQLKKAMGLDYCNIHISIHAEDKPPAYIKTIGYNNYEISISRTLKTKHERIGAFIHELGHIYKTKLNIPFEYNYDEERLIDCICIHLGFGMFLMNNITDEEIYIPGVAHQSEKRFFGYLKPEQFGYLFARYLKENRVELGNIKPFLTRGAHRYFKIGSNYLTRKNKYRISNNRIDGLYGCVKCKSFLKFPIDREISTIRCPNCNNSYEIATKLRDYG
ncbi:MAG: hypothetical protein KKF54_02990 [Candidatus Omnitrophica bacterium]|nr:hypothetical protein [Candidatus Omnitrophota bacterium]